MAEIESLLLALGVEVFEGAGSRIHLVSDNVATTVHRPHGRPAAGRPTVRQITRLLSDIAVTTCR